MNGAARESRGANATGNLDGLDFILPPEQEAKEPPEARGLERDEVRLMVSYRDDFRVEHARFRDIGQFLRPGDLLVINTSGTMNAALCTERADGTILELHLSTHLEDGSWSVELRLPQGAATVPFLSAARGESLRLPGGATIQLLAPYSGSAAHSSTSGVRLWRAALHLPGPLNDFLSQYGFPIRYSHVAQPWPTEYYQTVFATQTGSSEMPSAGRGFTPGLITRLVATGIQFAPLLLHTGVASLEDHEPPYAEEYAVSGETARIVNQTRVAGGRIIAVGTTVIRALETVTDESGLTHPGKGWTEVLIGPERGIRSVDGLLTGFHEPRATHLAMMEALADREHLRTAYAASLREGYLWHEFGDLHLLLPSVG